MWTGFIFLKVSSSKLFISILYYFSLVYSMTDHCVDWPLLNLTFTLKILLRVLKCSVFQLRVEDLGNV